jgi:predicted metalloprotease with PDZ domain
LEYESRLKASIEQGEKAREKEKLAETSTINEKSTVKQIPYFISIRDMNIPLKKSYRFYDFGFTVDNNLVINGFVYPDVFPGKDRVKTINSSPAEYAGVRLGDRIVSVNGRSVSGLSPIDVEKIIGSIRYIKLVVERQ